MRPWAQVVLLAFLSLTVSVPLRLKAQEAGGERKIVSKVAPIYPELARKLQIIGKVRVEVIVAPSGKLKSRQVVGGNPLLAKAAVEAIEQWKWVAAAQETKELIELNFILSGMQAQVSAHRTGANLGHLPDRTELSMLRQDGRDARRSTYSVFTRGLVRLLRFRLGSRNGSLLCHPEKSGRYFRC